VRAFLPMLVRFFIAIMIAVAAAAPGAALAQSQTGLEPPVMTLDEAKDAYLAAWNGTDLNATFSTFVQPFSAAGYGIYEGHGNVFQPGETVVLYVELVGYDHMPVPGENGMLYLMNLTADYTIASADGAMMQTIQDVPAGSIISHRPNTELFLELSLTQELPGGDYLVTYNITDEVSGESFALEKQITVAGAMPPGTA
jgi:hypothetical protein